MQRNASLPKLATIYGVSRSQIHRWAKRCLPLHDPMELAARLAVQDRPGKTLLLLTQPKSLRAVIAAIESLQPTRHTHGQN